jgi:hypothetical protein
MRSVYSGFSAGESPEEKKSLRGSQIANLAMVST